MSSDAGVVRLERGGSIAFITFDRPGARNAMTWAMYEQLDDALNVIAGDTSLRVAVLRGAGGHFVSGTDIAQFAKFQTADDGVSYERRLELVISKLESMRIATVAAVDGYAAGAGLVLATACDLRIATTRARFGVPIARTVGNCLTTINYARLVATLGASRTKAMLLTADWISSDEARAAGFVIAVVEPEAFEREIVKLCARLATSAPITIQVTKEAIRRIVSASLPDDTDLLRRAYGSADFREGVTAFVEKRDPNWEGR